MHNTTAVCDHNVALDSYCNACAQDTKLARAAAETTTCIHGCPAGMICGGCECDTLKIEAGIVIEDEVAACIEVMPQIAAARPVESRRTGILERWQKDTRRIMLLESALADVRDTIDHKEYPTLSAMIMAALTDIEPLRVM